MLSKNKSKWLRSLSLKKNRQREGLFIAEGPKLVGDLLAAGYQCDYLLHTDSQTNGKWAQIGGGCPVETCTGQELAAVSSLETPAGVLAVMKMRTDDTPMVEAAQNNIVLALDNVQNPGNLGTIVRLADWFGIQHLYCSHGTAELYNPKTVQATMGALAHVAVHYVDLAGQLTAINNQSADNINIPIYGTSLHGQNIYQSELTRQGVIVMGNEGRGLSEEVDRLVTQRLYIPPFGGQTTVHTESLNVAIATAVVCAEFRRREMF